MSLRLMLQGTGSSVGKSVLVAGLARAFVQRGLRVRPFKPQNMSNNAAVTADGGEIGRAQALQARAAFCEPSVHMNPVLLKPQGGEGRETGAQVVVQGRVFATARAREYQALKPLLMPHVLQSFAALQQEADLVLVEGAGSASEINLRDNDIANMGFAQATNTPVVLLGDIDRGGVIASLVGTQAVLPPEDAALIQGFIVNRMRGDAGLFADGMRFIAQRTGWPALGLVPHCADLARLPAEDAADLPAGTEGRIRVAVLMLPRISNFDDLDPLLAEPDLSVLPLRPGTPIPGDVRVVILPGSKATIADLASLREAGWDTDLHAHIRRGGHVLGLCGGYQMLGRRIADPHGIEGAPCEVPGLGLLDVCTVLQGPKTLRATSGVLAGGASAQGYEMHMGRTTGPDTARPFMQMQEGPDGATGASGAVAGTYLHGLFAGDAARAAMLARWGAQAASRSHEAETEAALDRWAAHLSACIDLDRLLGIAGGK